MRRFGPALRRQAAALLGRGLDPDDAVSQTWFQGVRRAGTYRPDLPVYGWLAAICARICLRQRKRHVALLARMRSLWDRNRGPRAASDFEGGTVVRRALASLPAKDATVLTLRFLFGLSTGEVAALCDDAPAAVRQRMSRALRRLRTGPFGEALGALPARSLGNDG